MLLFIVFGENGLSDLFRLKKQKDALSQKNGELKKENLSFYREIERLKHDPRYVEEVARKELGVIGKDEVIIKVKPKQRVSNKDGNIKK
jgi:cell division protein FtsB